MASEPFVVEIATFEGGLSQGAYTGLEGQYTYANGMNHWDEPGALMGNVNFEKFTFGPSTSGASILAVPYALLEVNDSNIQDVYGLFQAANRDTVIGWMTNVSNGSFDTTRYYSAINNFPSSNPYRHPSALAQYNQTLVFAPPQSDSAYQTGTSTISNASLYSLSATSTIVTDIITSFGYLYISRLVTSIGSNSTPGYIVRHDGSSGSFISDSSSVLDPAVQMELGWSPVCMENYGDYIAILALKTKAVGRSDWAECGSSRIYLWDGISSTFDVKVDVPGSAATAIRSHGGQLYLFCASVGGVDIVRYAGGNVTQRVGRVSLTNGVVKNTQDLGLCWVRKESISSHGDRIHFGVIHEAVSNPRGYLYSFNAATGAIDQIFVPASTQDVRGTLSALIRNQFNAIGFLTSSSPSSAGFYATSTDSFTASGFSVTAPTLFAPIGKKIKLKRVLLRHSYFPTENAVSLYVNRNLELPPRTSGASYSSGIHQLISVTGVTANVPGVGSASAYEHAYSFNEGDGPVPLLDSAQFTISVTNSSGLDRPRVFPPIVIEGEYVDSPN